jgi:nucleoside-diphosphate-sugar epimerase
MTNLKIFVAGATGALGLRLIPQLVARGHEVTGLTRTSSKQDLLLALGARPVEADALDPHPPSALQATLDAIRHVERAVTSIDWGDGVVLRYGGFYGPGTNLSSDPRAEMAEVVRQRKFPLVGDGAGVWSFIHIDDAAAATVAAVEHGATGIYQVVDDEPAPVRDWLPTLAKSLGAKPPRHLPRWLGRLAAGEAATVMMTEVRGASNAKAKRELGWQPVYSSWRTGFADGLG